MTQQIAVRPIDFLVSRLLYARIKRAASESVFDLGVEVDCARLVLEGTVASFFSCQLVEHLARTAMKDYGLLVLESRLQVS